MRTTKCIAGIELVSLIGNISRRKSHCEPLAEILSQRQIQSVVGRQVRWPIAIQEARAVIDREGAKTAPWQITLDPGR